MGWNHHLCSAHGQSSNTSKHRTPLCSLGKDHHMKNDCCTRVFCWAALCTVYVSWYRLLRRAAPSSGSWCVWSSCVVLACDLKQEACSQLADMSSLPQAALLVQASSQQALHELTAWPLRIGKTGSPFKGVYGFDVDVWISLSYHGNFFAHMLYPCTVKLSFNSSQRFCAFENKTKENRNVKCSKTL